MSKDTSKEKIANVYLSGEELENNQIVEWIKEYDEKYTHTLSYLRMPNYINRNKDKNYSNSRIPQQYPIPENKRISDYWSYIESNKQKIA